MVYPSIIPYNDTQFRTMFPTFTNMTTYPQVILQMYWDWATAYVSDVNYGWLNDVNRDLALNLMTAHIVSINLIVQSGQVPNLMQTAGVDKVSVGLTPPPIPNQWQWWLNQTGYGQQLLALLQVVSVGGFMPAGSGPRLGFRQDNGGFAGSWYNCGWP